MSSASSLIRAYRPDDMRSVRFQLGLSSMTPLAIANHKAYFHPVTLAAWVALSSIMIQLLNWWPTTKGAVGMWGLFTPLPALASVAVPLMFFFDWLHRPTFEEALQKILTAPDMRDPQAYYSRCPASGFYILEYNDRPIGLIAIDASPPPSSDLPPSHTPADTALIRHFHVEEAYRVSGVQSFLLEHAVARTFSATSPRPRRVRAVSSALDAYKGAALRTAGFHPASHWDSDEQEEWKVGVFGWKTRWVEVTRREWTARSSNE